jgi:hypothetical protein
MDGVPTTDRGHRISIARPYGESNLHPSGL